jgi:peroxiredoxin
VTVVAISADEVDARDQLVARLGLSFPVLADPNREVIAQYGVEDAENEISWPALFVIGQDQRVVERIMLDTYKERPLVKRILEAVPSAPPASLSASPKDSVP